MTSRQNEPATSGGTYCSEDALREIGRRHTLLIRAQQDASVAEGDVDAALGVVARYAREITGAEGAVVELAEGTEMVYRAASGTAEQHLGLRLSRTTSLSGRCVEQGTPIRCDDTETDPRVDRLACRKIGVRSMVVVPVQCRDTTIGVLKVYSPRPSSFRDEDTPILQLIVGTIVTATSRLAEQQARRDLKAQDERLRLAVEGAEIGTWHWDVDSAAPVWSDRCKAMFGLPADAVVSRDTLQACIHPADFPSVSTLLDAAIRNRADLRCEGRALWSDGSVHWIAARGRVYCDDAERPYRFEGIVQDIDARKSAEAAGKKAQAELEAINQRLERGIQETHHRIKNNLQIIVALIETQMSEHQISVPPEELAALSTQVSVLAALHDVLTEVVKTQSESELIPSLSILRHLGPLLKRTSPGRTLQFDWQDVQLSIRQGGAMALLVSELVRAAKKQGGTVIRVTLGATEQTGRLEVADNGSCAPGDHTGRDNRLSGLELVRTLAQCDLGGTFDMMSEAGGSLATVRFPLATEPR